MSQGPILSTRKTVNLLICLTVLYILSAIVYPKIKETAPQATSQPVELPTLTLSCGGDNDHSRLPQAKFMRLIVEPSDCWTTRQAMPSGFGLPENWKRRVRWEVDGLLLTRVTFADGTFEECADSPSTRCKFTKEITAFQFKNSGEEAVTVDMQLYR